MHNATGENTMALTDLNIPESSVAEYHRFQNALGRMMDDGEIANQIDEMAIKDVLETIEHDDKLAVATTNFLKLIAAHDWDCGCSERVRNVLMSNVESLGQIAFAALKNTIESN
jgi:hypothetical protein